MSGNGQGRILRPDAMSVETTYAAGPLAQPCAVTLQVPGGVKVLALGGLTKVEALAGQIVGRMHLPGDDDCLHLVARHAVDIAEAVLAECERRRAPKPEPVT